MCQRVCSFVDNNLVIIDAGEASMPDSWMHVSDMATRLTDTGTQTGWASELRRADCSVH